MKAYAKMGKSLQYICEKTGKSPKTVRKHLLSPDEPMLKRKPRVLAAVPRRRELLYRLVQETKTIEVTWKAYAGQSREVTRRLQYVEPAYSNATALAQELARSGFQVTPWVVNHDLALAGYRMVRRKTVVSMDPALWAERLAWAKKIKPQLSRMVIGYADECAITLAKDSSIIFHYRRPTDPRLPRLSTRASGMREKLHLWVCIAPGFRKVVLFNSNVVSEKYCFDCLETIKSHFTTKNLFLIHDNAQVHKSFETSLYIEENGLKILEIPPHSPDFNMVEKVFSYLKPLVSSRHPTRENFKQIILEEFRKIPQKVFDSFIGGLKNSIDLCIRREGKFHD